MSDQDTLSQDSEPQNIKIGLATAGRFHVADLARELLALGQSVHLYSYLTKKRALDFGIPDYAQTTLLPSVFPWVLAQRYAPSSLSDFVDLRLSLALNKSAIRNLKPCDVFLCMSGIYLEAAYEARRRYGAKIVLIRGSKHILTQRDIMLASGARAPSDAMVERELEGYKMADAIAVPSRHVQASFEQDSEAYKKLVVNSYGVDLEKFPVLPKRALTDSPVVVFAGIWCRRKGCDLLEQAVAEDERIRLIHVGVIDDYPFPKDHPRFEHIPKVDQSELPNIYARGDAFIQASREEGLSNVITQALASGLPILCSDATGGADLAHTPTLAQRIDVFSSGDVGALRAGLSRLCNRLAHGPSFPELKGSDRDTLSWRAFAARYVKNLHRVFPELASRG